MLQFGSYGGDYPEHLGWDMSIPFPDAQTLFTSAVFNPRPGGGGGPSAAESLSDLANATEAQLQANLAAYRSGQLSGSDAAARGWQLLNSMVSRMLSAGSIGRKSAAERDRRIDPAMLRWDWIAYYLDPIPDSDSASGAAFTPAQGVPGGVGQTPVFTGGFGFGGNNNQWIALALIVGLIWAMKKK